MRCIHSFIITITNTLVATVQESPKEEQRTYFRTSHKLVLTMQTLQISPRFRKLQMVHMTLKCPLWSLVPPHSSGATFCIPVSPKICSVPLHCRTHAECLCFKVWNIDIYTAHPSCSSPHILLWPSNLTLSPFYIMSTNDLTIGLMIRNTTAQAATHLQTIDFDPSNLPGRVKWESTSLIGSVCTCMHRIHEKDVNCNYM